MTFTENINDEEAAYFSEAMNTYDDIEAHDADVDRREVKEYERIIAA